jgi:imidazoleglycerol-phosphate dehydratase
MTTMPGAARSATIERRTRETGVSCTLTLDGTGVVNVSTGVGFLDHLLTALAHHAGFDLEIRCDGDLDVDDHHTAEDVAIVLGQAIDRSLGPRAGIRRFGHAYAPLDESLARAVVDLGGRGFARADLRLVRERIGTLACENVPHVIASMATNARASVHVDVLVGANDHHKAEAAFKALALALRHAVEIDPTRPDGVASTKGVL